MLLVTNRDSGLESVEARRQGTVGHRFVVEMVEYW